MISLADLIPQSVSLPGIAEAEAGFLEYGSNWIQHLEMGLDERNLEDLARAYAVHEGRLVDSGGGSVFPGIVEYIASCRLSGVSVALGADASRDYLMAVLDRHQLDSHFQIALCTEEFGMGAADEMLLEIMQQAEVNPSETLVLGTRAATFRAAHALDVGTIGCGWGIRRNPALGESDIQAAAIADLSAAVEKADDLACRNWDPTI